MALGAFQLLHCKGYHTLSPPMCVLTNSYWKQFDSGICWQIHHSTVKTDNPSAVLQWPYKRHTAAFLLDKERQNEVKKTERSRCLLPSRWWITSESAYSSTKCSKAFWPWCFNSWVLVLDLLATWCCHSPLPLLDCESRFLFASWLALLLQALQVEHWLRIERKEN